MPKLLKPLGEYPLNKRLAGGTASLDATEKKKISLHLKGFEPQVLRCPAHWIITNTPPMLTQHLNINKFSNYLICFQAINDTFIIITTEQEQ
jgi:hypothetical protein